MTEARWKLVVDGEGVTIASDRFQFRTSASQPALNALTLDEAALEMEESNQIEAIVSELQTMTRRTYGQFCGLSRALELVGERWSLLIIRDLLVGPKTVAELRVGFPRMAGDILCTRLSELERTGVIERTVPRAPDGAAVYRLTEWGSQLEDIVVRFSLWGTKLLNKPRPEDIVTVDSMVMALRSTFKPEAARGLRASYELRLGDIVIHAKVDDGNLEAGKGPLPGADLVVYPGESLKALMAGELSAADAIASGDIRVTGDAELLARFAEMFQVPRWSAESA